MLLQCEQRITASACQLQSSALAWVRHSRVNRTHVAGINYGDISSFNSSNRNQLLATLGLITHA